MAGAPQRGGPGAVFYRAPAHAYPLAVRARGVTITDADGREYLDMSGGAAVSCLGHGHPDVVAALKRQLDELEFAHTAFFTNRPQEDLAARIAGHFAEPGAHVYFTSGGSEANETALKLAWQYHAARGQPDRKVVVSREHSYHGNTFGVLSVSGNAGRRRASAAPLLDWPRIPPCYAYRERRDGESEDAYGARAADSLEEAIDACGAARVAAFICEPVVGSSLGVVPAAPGYLERVREICDRHGVLLIADEIMCGSGRTGTYFAHAQHGIVPDIVTLAKGIGGGYAPLAATLVRGGIWTTLAESGFAHGHTYVGHPLGCAAGRAVLEVIERDGLLARVQSSGEEFAGLLRKAFEGHPRVGDLRGRGLFFGIELVSDRASKAGFDADPGLADRLRLAALEEGLVCYPGSIVVDGRTVPHVMLAPPFIAEREQLEACVDRLGAALDRALPP